MNNKKNMLLAIVLVLVLIITPVSAFAAKTEASNTGETSAVYLPGDVDGDGVVNVNDVTVFQLTLVRIYQQTEVFTLNADVFTDRKITLRDATTIQMFLVGMYRKLPVSPDGYYSDVVRPT